MRRFGLSVALLALTSLVGTRGASAQESIWVNPDCKVICGAAILTQNMVTITNAISSPKLVELRDGAGDQIFPGADPDAEVDSRAVGVVRFTAAMPTKFKPLILFFDIQFSPFADVVQICGAAGDPDPACEDAGDLVPVVLPDGSTPKANSPLWVYGTIWRFIGEGEGSGLLNPLQNRFITLDFVPLFIYSPAADRNAISPYNHIFTPEIDFYLNIGRIFDPEGRVPWFRSLAIHVFWDFLIEPFDSDLAGFENPVLSIGLTTPLAPLLP